MASLSNSYNKWNRLEMSDEEDAGSGAGRPDQAERFAAHRQGMALVAQWVGEAAAAHGIEAPAREDLRLLLDFVAAQCARVMPFLCPPTRLGQPPWTSGAAQLVQVHQRTAR